MHRRVEPWSAKPLKPFHVDQTHGVVGSVLLDEPVHVANKSLSDAFCPDNGKRGHWFRAAFRERSGLQNGLSE